MGTLELLDAIKNFFPAPHEGGEPVDASAPTRAIVYKTISDQFGKFSLFKVIAGKVTPDMDADQRPLRGPGEAWTHLLHAGQEEHRGAGDMLRRHRRGEQALRHQGPPTPSATARPLRPRPASNSPSPATPWPSPQDEGPGGQGGPGPQPPGRGGSLLQHHQQRGDQADGHRRRRRHPARRALQQAQEQVRRGGRAQPGPACPTARRYASR